MKLKKVNHNPFNIKKVEGNPFESAGWQPDDVPQWGRDNPNLYGAVGATKEVGNTIKSVGNMAVDMVANVPNSAVRMASDIVEAVKHPIDTANAVGNVAIGGVEKLIPGEQGNERQFDQLIGFFADRYGSLDNLNKTISTDPVGFLADFSAIVAPAGSMVRGVGEVSKVKKLADIGEKIKTTGEATNPINVAREATVAVPKAALPNAKEYAVKMMEKQVKPSTVMKPKDRQAIIEYMLKNGIDATKSGLNKLEKRIKINNDLFDTTINSAAKNGETVSVKAIINSLKRTRSAFKDSLYAEDLLPHIDRAEELLAGHENSIGGRMPIDKARAMKTDLHKALKGAYGELSTVTDEAMKDIVHGINEQIYAKYPELKAAGLELKDQIALERELERAVNRLGNNNGISLHDIGLGGAVGVSGGAGLAASATLMNKILRTPKIKGMIARMIYKTGNKDFATRQAGKTKAIINNTAVAGRSNNK